MEFEVTQEMLNKAKGAKTVQELLELAKAEGIELTEEAAKEIFAKLHPESGELSDEELENVAGGAYYAVNLETGAIMNRMPGTTVKVGNNGWISVTRNTTPC